MAEYEVIKEGQEEVLKIDANKWPYSCGVEDEPRAMNIVIGMLSEAPQVSRIIINQRRNYSYDYEQTGMLVEVANTYNYLTRQKRINYSGMGPGLECDRCYSVRYADLQYVLNNIKADPISAYVELKRILRREQINLKKQTSKLCVSCIEYYINLMDEMIILMDKLKLIQSVKEELAGYRVGDRILYREILRPVITPDFMFAQLMMQIPSNAEQVEVYSVEDAEINILKVPGDVRYFYHVTPVEFKLTEDNYMLLDLARTVLAEHKPREEEFLDPERMRRTFMNIGVDLITELAQNKGISLDLEEIKQLAKILVRYTVGFGLIEVLLQDKKIQDVVVNGPVGQTPIFIVHQDFDECVTNIVPSSEDAESWASKFRMLSGRPLDEANPVLDTELSIPSARARVAVISRPLNPFGLGYALRRHRDEPWTYPLYISNKMLNPLAAGLLSFLVDGSRSLIFGGTRSSGKCVDGNTLIQLADGSIQPIKELIGKKKRNVDDGEICYPKERYFVPSLNKFNFIESEITDVWKRSSPEKVVKLKTKSGRDIITTKEHPYFVYEECLKNVRANELKKGDLIAIPRRINVNTKKIYLNLSDEKYCIGELEDAYIFKGATNSLKIQFPKEITVEFAEFLGLIIGDGHLDQTKLEFHNLNADLRSRVKSFLDKYEIKYREYKSRTSVVVQVSCRIFSRLLNKYFEIPFGKKSDKIVIPKLILNSENNVLAAFLRGYFDTDGYIPNKKRDIELCTASKIMSEHLKLALLRFEIICFSKVKIVKGNKYYRNLIRGNFVNKFAEHIGFSHSFKKERLEEISSLKFMENTNVDVISGGNRIVSELRKKLRICPKVFRSSGKDYWSYENNEYRVTRNWFGKIIKFYKSYYYNQLKSYKDRANLLRNFVEFNYQDYMLKIEKLRVLLGLSYISIAHDLGFSDKAIKHSLQNNVVGTFEKVRAFTNVSKNFENRLLELEKICLVEPVVENISHFTKSGVVSYAALSRETGIPETTIKSYTYGGVKSVDEKRKLIERELYLIKQNLVIHLNEARDLLNGLIVSLPVYTQVGLILANLRGLLDIKNEELVSECVSLQTISNFFSGKYICQFDVVNSLIKSIIKIYDSCVNDNTEKLIDEAEMLANSDIFWDEVLSVEVIGKVDDFVYDLSVGSTHNFIANGLVAHNTSLLGATLLEIMRKYRILTVEDTLELNTDVMRKLGYNIQSMKVRAALMSGGAEIPADEGIRTSLRMGDSSLIIGEIRSSEALALFESMRIGALANVVAGTIHGADPYSIFDRVVNDLKVPRTSFKAVDVIVVSNPIKSPDGLHKWKRVLQIAEVRKHWEEDPLRENGFVDLMLYDPKEDTLKPSADLMNGDSDVIKAIAGNVKEWAGNWDAVWENILLRARIKETLAEYAKRTGIKELLEARFVVNSNDMFHMISDNVREEVGYLDSKMIYERWDKWTRENIKGV